MTLKRIRAYSTISAAALWIVWIVDISVPGAVDRLGKVKGTDFLQFYVGGSFVREGRLNSLYDVHALFARAQAIAPGSRDTLYLPIQSPQTALAFAPLSAFSYPVAVNLWIAVIVLLYSAACWMTWRYCPTLRRFRYEAIAVALAFPGLYSTVLFGQTSALALFAITVALLALKHGWPFTAGLAVGCLAFKPHWLIAAGAVFVVAREWRVVAGAFIGGGAQIGLTYLLVGPAVLSAYVRALEQVPRLGDLLEPYPGDSLRSFFKVFVPSTPLALVLYVAAALVTLYIAARIWRSDAPFEIRASGTVVATLLISPHAFPYDLILLAPVYLLMANWLLEHHSRKESWPMSLTLYASFAAPLLSVLPAPLRLQCSVTAMALLLLLLWRVAIGADITSAPELGDSAHSAAETPAVGVS